METILNVKKYEIFIHKQVNANVPIKPIITATINPQREYTYYKFIDPIFFDLSRKNFNVTSDASFNFYIIYKKFWIQFCDYSRIYKF